jgi:hypothetical protein
MKAISMSEWIDVNARLPNRNEPTLELKVSYYYPGENKPRLSHITGKFSDGKFIADLPNGYMYGVMAWKEPTAQQYTKNFKTGKYFSNEDTPTLPNKTTYKYPNIHEG